MATTALYPNALPGPARTFSAKASLAAQITELWPNALPGPRHAFTPKTAAPQVAANTAGAGQAAAKKRKRKRLADDELILLV